MNFRRVRRISQRIKDCVFGYNKQFEKEEDVNIPMAIQYLALLYYFAEHLLINNYRSEWKIANGYQTATLLTKHAGSQYNGIIGRNVVKDGICQWNIECINVTSTMHCGIMMVRQSKVDKEKVDKDMGMTMRKRKGSYVVIGNNGTKIIKKRNKIKFVGSFTPTFDNGDMISINLNATSGILTFRVKDKLSNTINIKKNANGYRLFCGLFNNGDCIKMSSFEWN